MEGKEGDALISSESYTAIKSASFADGSKACCMDFIQNDEQMAILSYQIVNIGVGHAISSSGDSEIDGLFSVPQVLPFFGLIFF